MFEEIRYSIWPAIKPRLRYWWWIVKYRGKKNIPKEVVLGALTASVDRLVNNMQAAQNAIPLEDMTEEERLGLRELNMRLQKFKGDVEDLGHNDV